MTHESRGPGARTAMVVAEIRRRLATRLLTAGDRLPSIRGLAGAMQVSPSTVVEAYERLVAEGLVRSRPGSGFYAAGPVLPLAVAEVAPRLDRAVDPFWVSRQSLDAGPAVGRPGCGWLPADWMPQAAIRRALRGLAKAEDDLLAYYGGTRGSLALRRLLARQFAAEGLDIGIERVLLTGSGTQALDLLFRLLLRPGDTVLVDDPCYFNFLALLRAHRVRIVGVPITANGPDVAAFAASAAEHRPRLYVTNSAIHNPTGASLSPQLAHRVLTAASTHGVTIIEDDIFAELEPEPSPRLAVLDGLATVVRIGSFSKTLSASVRCGYIAAPTDWIEALIDLQVATNFGGPSPVAAELVATALGDGTYRRHLAGLRTRLAKRRTEVGAALVELGIQPWTLPRGGFQLWCRLPDGRSASALAEAALRSEGIVLAPGDVFSVGLTAPDMMRFNVAHTDKPALEALRRLLGTSPA